VDLSVKIIINQSGTAIFTVGQNQFHNITQTEADGVKYYSIGVEHISLALYKREKQAVKAFNALMKFIVDDSCDSFRFELDK
jgi:hypothetical protein